MSAEIVRIHTDRAPRRGPDRGKSQFDRYPLPFFDRSTGNTWAVTSTGNYTADYELGRRYGVQFLMSCDGTVGWSTLLGSIACDMAQDPNSKESRGIVIGFMRTVANIYAAHVSPHRMTRGTDQPQN